MLVLDFSAQNKNEQAEADAIREFDELQRLEPSADIAMHLECDGKWYYAWSIQYQYGMSSSLLEAITELYAACRHADRQPHTA